MAGDVLVIPVNTMKVFECNDELVSKSDPITKRNYSSKFVELPKGTRPSIGASL